MNKGIIYLLTFIFSLGFVACSDDDYPDGGYNGEIAGTYKGDIGIKLGDAPKITELQKVYITKSEPGKVNLAIKDFSFQGITLGNIEVNDIIVVKEDDLTRLTETKTTVSLDMGQTPRAATEQATNADVTVWGTVKNKVLDLTIKVYVAGIGDINVSFGGDKMAVDNEKTEALIKSMRFEESVVVAQPTIDGTNITFYVSENAEDAVLQKMKPIIVVSDGATVNPVSGTEINFTSGTAMFTVTAEDKIHKTVYTVTCVRGDQIVTVYDFENWTQGGSAHKYAVPTGWATCNPAVEMIIVAEAIDFNGPYPVNFTTDARTGSKAIEMVSQDTKGGTLLNQPVPKVTAATAFLGKFNILAGLGGALKTTQFGILFDRKPLQVKGYYKYTPGSPYYNNGIEDPAGKDELSVNAVLYEVIKDSETLDGTNIYTDSRIVARASFASGETKTEYTPFNLTLNYEKEYDSSKKYKFTVIMSASKDGADYKGAVGSTLIVDDVSVISE